MAAWIENYRVLSIIIPTLNEATGIARHLVRLRPLRDRGGEVIVVDGGSTDGTVAEARPFADVLLTSPRGRAVQMNVGAARARGGALLFLHADTRLPPDADLQIDQALARAHQPWGHFVVDIEGNAPGLRIIAAMMNLRSRLTGIATGDQAIFVRRDVFRDMGGFAEIALMEDIALSRALKRKSPPACIARCVVTSGRRWEHHGTFRTILLMWRLRLAFALGANPARLAAQYRDVRES